MKRRTFEFCLRMIRLVKSLKREVISDTIGKQLLRSATSVGANYRAACRARSPAEFRAKLGICEEECDESIYWIELLVADELVKEERVSELLDEANQLLAIIVSSIKTSRSNDSAIPNR